MLHRVCLGTYGIVLREHDMRFTVNKPCVRIVRPHCTRCETFPPGEIHYSLWLIINLETHKPPLIKLHFQPKQVTGHESIVGIIYIL